MMKEKVRKDGHDISKIYVRAIKKKLYISAINSVNWGSQAFQEYEVSKVIRLGCSVALSSAKFTFRKH